MDLQHDATVLLQRLLRIDTVNPPGNEREAQELLAAVLRDAGFEVQLLGRTEARPNLVARLRGTADGPTLGLLSHVDTVLADPAEWQHGPWSGDVADGFVWGRGAIDMKSQTAAEVAAAASLARDGWRPARGDLLVVALADEETGGDEGVVWLTEHHPELVRCDYVINEGAGALIPFEGERLYGVCVAEKGVLRLTLTTTGAAGHASAPAIADNALLKMAPLLELLRQPQIGLELTPAPQALLEALGVPLSADGGPPDAGHAMAALRERDAGLATMVEPMLGITLAPTRISASEKINVIPARAALKVDCRTPTGMSSEEALGRVRALLAGVECEIAVDEQRVGNGSAVDSPLMDAIAAAVGRADPEGRVVPTMLPAFTDSRAFRTAFPEVVAYGFFPHRHMTLHDVAPLVHGKDERIDVRDLGFAAACFRDVVVELLG